MNRFLILLISALPLSGISSRKVQGCFFQIPVQAADFNIYSNPAGGSVKIIYESPRAGKAYLSLFSESGKLLSRKRVEVLGGRNQWKQTLPSIGSNSYLVVLNMDSIERKATVFKTNRN